MKNYLLPRWCARWKEAIELWRIASAFKQFEQREQEKVYDSFYQNRAFAIADQQLLAAYTHNNPFVVSNRFFSKDHSLQNSYGETPLTLFEKIGNTIPILPTDRLFDLGCGRGRLLFFAHTHYRCTTVGVDLVQPFIEAARKIARPFEKMQFLEGDLSTVDLSSATIIYLCGVCLEEAPLAALSRALQKLTHQVTVITISYPLSDFYANGELLETIDAIFPWGKTIAYISRTKN